MTKIDALSRRCCVVAVLLLAACGKDDAAKDKSFDAAFVAAEADKGNLEPLKALVDACHAEASKQGHRDEACGVLDSVGPLRKPLSIRF
ncbi:hypothetical protein [Variovorax sp. RCC_210]|uniref:hypothetical protein n=1 Tax=Variovorax sp. RCC_210 TaxID=3239217 RepID=UPI0035245B65